MPRLSSSATAVVSPVEGVRSSRERFDEPTVGPGDENSNQTGAVGLPTVVVPYRGTEGKSRLARLPVETRAAIGEAMLADVVAACAVVGRVFVVTTERLAVPATIVPDPGGGQ